MCATNTHQMDSILHKINIGMFQANAQNETYEEDCSQNGLNRKTKFIHEECARDWYGIDLIPFQCKNQMFCDVGVGLRKENYKWRTNRMRTIASIHSD